MMDVSQGQERVRAWPRPRPTTRSAAQRASEAKFAAAQLAAKYISPGMMRDVIEARKGTPILPRDITTSILFNRFMAIGLPKGGMLYPMPARNDVSESLDTITQTPGFILIRGTDSWEAMAVPGFPVPPTGLTPPHSSEFPTLINSPGLQDGDYAMRVFSSASATLIRAALQAPPAGDFEIIANVQSQLRANFNSGGIVMKNSAGKYLTIGKLYSGGNSVVMQQFNSATSFNADLGLLGLGVGDSTPEFFRAVFDSTAGTVTGFWSCEPDNWSQIAVSSWLGQPDGIGLGHGMNNGGVTAYLYSAHWAVS